MKKYIIIENKIVNANNKKDVLIDSDNKQQLENVLSTLNMLTNELYSDVTGSYTKYKLDDDLKKQKWHLVYVDVNNLKTVNDGFGHIEGDKYLKKVVKLLKNYAPTYRQGGDEFIMLFDKLSNLKHFVKDNRYNNQFAFGYALKTEYSTISEAIYLADKRMYEYKTSYKENRKNKINRIKQDNSHTQ